MTSTAKVSHGFSGACFRGSLSKRATISPGHEIAVVMLDSAVQSVDLGGPIEAVGEKPEIRAARIAFSRWMSRGWAFQKAGQAQSLFSGFQDMFGNCLDLTIRFAPAKDARTGTHVLAEESKDGCFPLEGSYISLSDPCYGHLAASMNGIWRWCADKGDSVLKGLREDLTGECPNNKMRMI